MQFLPDAAYPNEGDSVQAMAGAVTHVAMALDELKEQLELANRRVGEVAAAQITEAELGRLFVRAAQFADTAIADAEQEAGGVVAAAKVEAERILAGAKQEATAIVEESQRVSRLSADAALQVQATIEGFTRVNQELARELKFLVDVLQPRDLAGTAASLPARSSAAVPSPVEPGPTRPPVSPPWAVDDAPSPSPTVP